MEELKVRFKDKDHDGELVCLSKNVCDAGAGSTHTKQEVLNNEPCLICSGTTNDAWYRSFQLLSGSEGCELLNEQIWSIFILRKLLDFPRQKCTTLMEETLGVSNPKTWFTLCGSCTDTVKSAMKVYLQILKLERDLSGFQHALKNTIQETLKTDMDNQTKRTRKSGPYSENIVNIRTRIRSHFSEVVDKESIVPKQEFEEEEDIFQESGATFEHLDPTRMNEDFCEDDDIERNYLYGQHSDSEYDNVRPKRSRTANVPSQFYGTEEEETETEESFKSEGEISTAQMFANISVDENELTKKKWEGGYRKGKAIGRTRQRLLLDSKNRRKFCCKICGIKYTYLRSYKCHMIKHKNQRQKQRVRLFQNHKRDVGATEPLDAVLINTIKRKATEDEMHSEEAEVENTDQMSEYYESGSSYVPSEGESDPLEPNDGIPQKKKEYKCKRCNFVTKIRSRYRAHTVAHRPKKHKKRQSDEAAKCVCEICGRRFQTRNSFTSHMSQHKYKKEFECPNCHYPCVSQSALEKHLKNNHCERSNENYEQVKNERYQKMLAEQQKSVHDCELCKRRFDSLATFKKHMRDHDIYKNTTCSRCNYPCLNESSLKKHLRYQRCFISTGIRTTYQCEYCSYSTTIRYYFEIHCCEKKEAFLKLSLSTNIKYEADTRDTDKEVTEVRSVEEQMKDDNDTCYKYQATEGNYEKTTSRDIDEISSLPLNEQCESVYAEREKCQLKSQKRVRKPKINFNEKQGPSYNKKGKGSDKHDCEICGRGFQTRNSLTSHISVHRYNKEFECPKCRYPYRTAKSLEKHLAKNHCERSNLHNEDNQSGGEEKIIEEKQKPAHHCEICKRKFASITSMKKHMWEHKNCKDSTCPKCYYPCLSKSVLEAHLELENCFKFPPKGTKITYNCDDCPYSTTFRYDFHIHIRRHKIFFGSETADGRWKCVQCNEVFSTQRTLAVHKREVHELEIPVFRCSLCSKSYSKRSGLKRHVKEFHEQEFRFFCEVCGYRAYSRFKWELHMSKHKDDKKSICELCGMSYRYSHSLANHMKTQHPGGRLAVGKEFKCKFCPDNVMTFPNKALLNDHLKNGHQDLYIHKCDQCDNSYMSLGSLQLHKKINHTSHRVECQFCHKFFLSRVYLYSHYGKKGACKKKPSDFKFSIPRVKLTQ